MAKSSSSKKTKIQPKRSVQSSSIDVTENKSSTLINNGTDNMNQSNKKNKNIQNDELKKEQERIVTMEALQNLSDDDDDDDDGPLPPESEWTKEALALKAAIEAGKFDAIVQQSNNNNNDNNDNDESSFEEVDLETDEDEDDYDDEDEDEDEQRVESKKRKIKGQNDEDDVESNEEEVVDDDDDEEEEEEDAIDNDDDDNNNHENGAHNLDYEDDDDDGDDDDDEEEEDVEQNDKKTKRKVKNNFVMNENVDGQDVAENDDEMIDDDDDDDDEEQEQELAENDLSGTKALRVVTASLMLEKKDWSWSEKFDIIPPTPLPFNKDVGPTKSGAAVPASNPLGIHDDLQREVAFYDVALDAVIQAKLLCQKAGIPFTRPDDFFAEMVKTDDHMAKVKDRLIFEGKKIEAVAQRKSNKEHKLRAKETQSNKLAEKAKKKREHMQAVNDWAESAKANRGTNDNTNIPTNKKRAYSDQKFGHGGKRGRFKQNDPQSMNDMSAFNKKLGTFTNQPKTKHGNTRAKAGSGANRKGKRARDASRSRSR